MRNKKFFLLFSVLLAFMYVNQVHTITYNLPLNTTIRSGLKVHFGDYWLYPSGTDMTVTSYFVDNWLNYTVAGSGTQQVHNGTIPQSVILDGVNKSYGDGWSYGAGTVTITAATSTAALSWAVEAAPPPSTGSGFDIYFESVSTLSFQGTVNIDFQCSSGNWNATNSTFTLNPLSGSLAFSPYENCTLFISTSHDRTFHITASGVTLIQSEGNYTASVISGSRATINWRFLPYSFIDHYFMLSIGMAGIVMLIAGPSWFARTYVKNGLSDNTIEHLGYAMLLVVLGFGFVIIWLWPI